ncbi:hypothetical protein HPP92_004805 [Vanilla planifolia]|uniref:Uncharacterized protein n=1 Tax=Vanilla planifolia TaxID=51239 RepID=A0A835VET0_VANPL|nr:hypothetical protein HPP92_004805 [Vanilla planifolia]
MKNNWNESGRSSDRKKVSYTASLASLKSLGPCIPLPEAEKRNSVGLGPLLLTLSRVVHPIKFDELSCTDLRSELQRWQNQSKALRPPQGISLTSSNRSSSNT